jgi:hypothetical protein
LTLWKDFCAFVYWSWVQAAPASAVDWTETQFDLTRAWSWEDEYVGGGVMLWSLSHCWSSDLDQEVYAIDLINIILGMWTGQDIPGESLPNQEAFTAGMDRATRMRREGRMMVQ